MVGRLDLPARAPSPLLEAPAPRPGEARRWAVEEFGAAELGDRRRVARLVRMASALLAHTAGTITQAFGTPRSDEGPFDSWPASRSPSSP
ncbi:MAG: hypothetical protein IPN17_30460 [Deltaproteobacteria bacterium]|nr:hypothetical protein [Deltaproteobacteria bacterium]